MVTMTINWDAKLGHPKNIKPLNVDISDAIQHSSGLSSFSTNNKDYGVNGRQILDPNLNYDQIYAMTHFDSLWSENLIQKISQLTMGSNSTALLPVWQEFQSNDGSSRIFPATIQKLKPVDMRIETEYRNSYIYENDDLLYFSPPKMDENGIGLVVDVKKTVTDANTGSILGTFKNVYMLKQVEEFLNSKMRNPMSHVIFNEYGRVIYLPKQTYFTRLLSKLIPDIGIPLLILLMITILKKYKKITLGAILFLCFMKLENPLKHTGINGSNQEPGAVSEIYYEELIKDINIFDLYRKGKNGNFEKLINDLDNQSFDKLYCGNFQKFPVTRQYIKWKKTSDSVEQIANTNLFKLKLPDTGVNSAVDNFVGVGNIYFTKANNNQNYPKNENDTSRFDLCKYKFPVVDKQICPEVVLSREYKSEQVLRKSTKMIPDKEECFKNFEDAGVLNGKLERNLDECSCFDGGEHWENFRFYPEHEKNTNQLVYCMIAVVLWILITMAYFIFHEVDEEFEEYSKKTYDNSMKGIFQKGASRIYQKANTVFRQSTRWFDKCNHNEL